MRSARPRVPSSGPRLLRVVASPGRRTPTVHVHVPRARPSLVALPARVTRHFTLVSRWLVLLRITVSRYAACGTESSPSGAQGVTSPLGTTEEFLYPRTAKPSDAVCSLCFYRRRPQHPNTPGFPADFEERWETIGSRKRSIKT